MWVKNVGKQVGGKNILFNEDGGLNLHRFVTGAKMSLVTLSSVKDTFTWIQWKEAKMPILGFLSRS